MKRQVTLLALSLLVTGGFSVAHAAADLNGAWKGTMRCSNDPADDPGEYFKVEIVQSGDFFE